MKHIIFILAIIGISCNTAKLNRQSVPANFKGSFIDDYGIAYTINDSFFIQHPKIKYRILQWNAAGRFIIAQNDTANPSDKNLHTRIDYLLFENMQPFTWGFCYTAYNATSAKAAIRTASADRNNPKKGCNGYPFSRLKPQ